MSKKQKKSFDNALNKSLEGIPLKQINPVVKALQGIAGVQFNHHPPAVKALQGIAGVQFNHHPPAVKALQGIAGVDWNQLSLVEKALQGIASERAFQRKTGVVPTIEKASFDFMSRLSSLPKRYNYHSEKQNNQKPLFSVVSEETKQPVPVEELESAFGLLDIIGEVTEEEMIGFVGHLLRYPMLALEHRVGRLIRDTVNGLVTTGHISGSFYRCRVRNSDQLMPWTEAEMWEAPNGVSAQGRFNTIGSGFLYLSRDQEAAVLEMKQPMGTIIDIMKLAFEAEIKVIDITDDEVALFRYCMFKVSNDPSRVKKEYLVSNFLGQCCQKENIHAIKYKSVLAPDVSNYVFFDYLKEWFKYESSASVRTGG
ncbi:RES family NAD+ phosphorylase [Brevibacillus formosus]|uniref:RES family NAD+ phosphorylase n=1 Tax=Brevibacillus formosus TaxID=54913 RepID=UPI002E231888|nr:RES family NAD+ phosphorylase [Brevibacillus formosus]